MQDLTPGSGQLARVLESIPHARRLGMSIESLSEGRCVLSLELRPELLGDPERGILHGGVVTTLLDSATATAAITRLAAGVSVATLDLRIDYLKPSAPGLKLFAAAELYKLTTTVAFVRGHAYQRDEDQPIAHAMATFMIGSVGFVPGASV